MMMQDVVSWLREVENLASSVYLAAAEVCADKPEHVNFFNRLAKDEAWHCHLMGSASEILREQEHMPICDVLVDDEIKLHVEAPLRSLLEKIKKDCATEQNILEALVKSETSEWNEVFLYVIAVCTQISPAFQYVASAIQAHESRIERYIESVSTDPELKNILSALPKIWTSHLLVVEDDPVIRHFFKHIMSRYGTVITAENGEEGLKAVDQQFFDVIVTDVDMPILDGISFLERACKKHPHLKAHFVVCTGRLTERVSNVALEHGVSVLEKPVRISKIRSAIEYVLNK